MNLTDWTSDDFRPCQQEETNAIVYPPPVQASNDKISAQSGVSKLPVELILLIFDQCDSEIRARLVLTHTCRRWRLIAVNYPHIWTNVLITTHNLNSKADRNRFESLLTLQVERSRRLPLDITWDCDFASFHDIPLFVSIQHVVPFSRWRSLELRAIGRSLFVERHLASVAVFPNLEALVISKNLDLDVAAVFCTAVKPKLQVLHLRMPSRSSFWEDPLIILLNGGTLSLPDSIVTLQAGVREAHPFPNILNYELEQCTFRSYAPIDLRSMTNLIIDGWLIVDKECEVLLPSLQYLRLMTMEIRSGGKIEAPSLQTLHLSVTPEPNDPPGTIHDHYVAMCYAVHTPGYRLSPKKLVFHEPYLSNTEIIALLTKSRELTQATVCLSHRKCAQEIMEALFDSSTEDTLPTERLCPQLEELMLDCWWDVDVPLSAEQLLSGLDVRKADTRRTRVLIKARRKGEERYQLLGEW